MIAVMSRDDDRRSGQDRRGIAAGGRRRSDRVAATGPLSTLQATLWAVIGAAVVLYLFFAALGTIDLGDAKGFTIAAAVLAALWLAHSWRRLWAGGFSAQSDRERRGF
jgi:hypothetical protein